MSTQLVKTEPASLATVERVVVQGDLSKLTPDERLAYYKAVCDSAGLNPLTKPFEYITLNGRLTLYARKDCTDQLRHIHQVSVSIVAREIVDECYVVTSRATFPTGRTDESIGAVSINGLKGEAKCNAMMKAETKAKRRVTLSICGLGMLDETEIETIPSARPPVTVTTEDIPLDIGGSGTGPAAEVKGLPTAATPAGADLGTAPATASDGRQIAREGARNIAGEAEGSVGARPASSAPTERKPRARKAPASDERCTLEQQDYLRLQFKDILPASMKEKADDFRRDWLKRKGYIKPGPNGTEVGTSTTIPRDLFREVCKEALQWARELAKQ